MKMARWLLAAIAVVCALGSAATGATYYVDATNGDDTKDGQSTATAWKTIAKVNSSSFAPGDQILLKRGEVWRESLVPPSSGTSGNPIRFDAYGSGEAPTLTGYLPLPSGAWTLDSGNVWKATVTGNSMFWVLFGSMWGSKQTAKANVLSDRDYYFASNTLYVFSQGNPATYYANVAAMLMANGQLLLINGKQWLDVQHIKLTFYDTYGVKIAGASDHINIANVYADGQIPAGTLPHGMYVGASPGPTDINFYNVDSHRNYNGFRFDAPATLIQVKNCRGYANRNKGLEDNTGAAHYSYSHFFANNIAILNSQDKTGGVDGGHNLADDTWPAVKEFEQYPARVSLTVDDVGLATGADTYVNSLLPLFESRGLKLSIGVTAGYASALLPTIQGWLNSGHDINSHSWSHQYYTNPNAFSVKYTGTGTAATMTISGNHLVTTITGGPGGENLNLDFSDPGYDSLSKVVATLNSRAVYSAAVDPASVGAVHSIALADVSTQDIKTGATGYMALLQKDRLVPDEMTTSRNWLQANIAGLSNVKVYVYPSGIEDTQTQGWAVAAGYEGGRGGLSMGLGSKEVYAAGVNLQDVTSLGMSGLHGMTQQQIATKMAALVFKAKVWGVPYGLFWHTELSSTEVGYVLDALLNNDAEMMTNTQLIDAIHGMAKVGSTTYYVSPDSGVHADFQPTRSSPIVDAGTDAGDAFRYDIDGIDQTWFGANWDIGAYAVIGASPYVVVVQ